MSIWKRPPKTLSAALKRIEVLESRLFWCQDENRSTAEWGRENAEEVNRLGRLLTYRAKVGDAIAICPHLNTEVGKISGNVYCSDCQEVLERSKPVAS